MKDEVWKVVPSKSGVIASSLGRVKLPCRSASMPNGGRRDYITKPTYGTNTKACKNARHLYKGIYAKRFGNMKIHRLVCEAFHGAPPSSKSVVLHLDEDGLNNKP